MRKTVLPRCLEVGDSVRLPPADCDKARDCHSNISIEYLATEALVVLHSQRGFASMDKVTTDADQLAQLGHAQSFERQFSKWSMLGLAFAILNSWAALAAGLSFALPSGSSCAVLWGLVTAGICNLSLAASLAEMLSAFPTAGGQ